jgi:hypothetical protein
MTMKRMIYLITFLCLPINFAVGAPQTDFQGKIVISKINNQVVPAPDKSPGPASKAQGEALLRAEVPVISLEPVVEVQGTIADLERKEGEVYLAQVVVNRMYDGSWWVVGSSSLEAAGGKAGKSGWRWAVRAVRFPLPDYSRGFKIMAVLVRQGRELPAGLVDYETVQQYALALSDPVRGSLRCGGQIEITHIKDIYGKWAPLAAGDEKPIEVDLMAEIRGKVDKPGDAYVYVVVHPTASGQKWVMERKGETSDRDWSETGYFGGEGKHAGELFRLQAIVSKKPLDYLTNVEGGIPPERWRDEVEWGICATSGEVLVRRRIGPADLVIKWIDEKEVIGRDPIPAEIECQVAGSIEDPKPVNMLKPGETVWILFRPADSKVRPADGEVRPAGGEERWTVGALALTSPDNLNWRVPALRFPKAGQYKLIAVAASRGIILPRGDSLTDDDWHKLASAAALGRLSRMVTVNVEVNPGVAPTLSTENIEPRYTWLWITAILVILAGLTYATIRFRRVAG